MSSLSHPQPEHNVRDKAMPASVANAPIEPPDLAHSLAQANVSQTVPGAALVEPTTSQVPPDAASDALIANLLAALKPGLTPLEFWRWLYNDFMQALTDLPALSEASLVRYLEFATMKLKE